MTKNYIQFRLQKKNSNYYLHRDNTLLAKKKLNKIVSPTQYKFESYNEFG